ncbi:hypothetical protein D3C75_1305660 [compost metagenome]
MKSDAIRDHSQGQWLERGLAFDHKFELVLQHRPPHQQQRLLALLDTFHKPLGRAVIPLEKMQFRACPGH